MVRLFTSGKSCLASLALAVACVGPAFADPAKDCEQNDDFDLKVRGCTQFLKSAPATAKYAAYYFRGYGYANLGKLPEAIADYGESIRLKPDFADAYFARGLANEAAEKRDAAIADFSQTLRLAPDMAEAYLQRGFARIGKKDDDLAAADFNEAIRKKPDLTVAYFGRGLVSQIKGRHDAAVSDYTYVAGKDADLAGLSYFMRAQAYEAKGQAALADADYKAAGARDPKYKLERSWVEYLKSLEARASYGNWIGRPYELYLRTR